MPRRRNSLPQSGFASFRPHIFLRREEFDWLVGDAERLNVSLSSLAGGMLEKAVQEARETQERGRKAQELLDEHAKLAGSASK